MPREGTESSMMRYAHDEALIRAAVNRAAKKMQTVKGGDATNLLWKLAERSFRVGYNDGISDMGKLWQERLYADLMRASNEGPNVCDTFDVGSISK